jgi:hypothetical protein
MLDEADYDYEPGTLIPTSKEIFDLRQKRTKDGKDQITVPDQWESTWDSGDVVPQFERARWHTNNFEFSAEPYSLHEMHSMTRKLIFIQRKKAGFPMDPWTEAEMFDDRNFGDPPNIKDEETGEWRKPRTGFERWQVWTRIQAALKQAMSPPAGAGGARGGAGRPSTDAQPPTMEQKANGASTIRTSKHAG